MFKRNKVIFLYIVVSFFMSGKANKSLIYVQRISLIVLGFAFFMTFLFVLNETASAEGYTTQNSVYKVRTTAPRGQSFAYLVRETPKIVPDFVFEEELPSYDLVNDDSYEKYLSADTPFENIEYIPSDLLPVNSSFTANYSKRYYLREEAGIQFANMAWNFWHDFDGDKIWLASAYRSKTSQATLIKNGCSRVRCAQPGTSEHQAGLAVDMRVVSKYGTTYSLYSGSKYFQWFADNAHKRGFHNTYQKGIEIDGQMIEGRHWRYLGKDLATKLYEEGLTIAEYYQQAMSGIVISNPAF